MADVRDSARTYGKSDPIDALAVARAALREPDPAGGRGSTESNASCAYSSITARMSPRFRGTSVAVR